MGTYTNRYSWQAGDWPRWRYDLGVLAEPLALVSRSQGVVYGRLAEVGAPARARANLAILTQDVVATSAIAGVALDPAVVRSALAQRLGGEHGARVIVDRRVDGAVAMVLDGMTHARLPVTIERLCGWHRALFPGGYSGTRMIRTGQLRDDKGTILPPVAGAGYHQGVPNDTPTVGRLAAELPHFVDWVNADSGEPALIKAGLAQLWLASLRPFEDGNGRIARAVSDLLLVRADPQAQRFYSVSAQLQREQQAYGEILERTRRGQTDATGWLYWFVQMVGAAVVDAGTTVDSVLEKTTFWQRWREAGFNDRQIKMLNAMLDGYEGAMTSRKWAQRTKTSQDTAIRDINQLLTLGVLVKNPGRGRNASYTIAEETLVQTGACGWCAGS